MKKYVTVYQHFRDLIENGQLKNGDKMPSIRNAQSIFSVSKTTIQTAYFALQADGYIIASEKSGHYVSDFKSRKAVSKADKQAQCNIKYDLKSGDADNDAFDLKLWHRYIKNALRQQERLLSYSAVQGEQDLREALSDYIREKRNVTASADRIIIGAGVQCLLQILCSLIKERETVSFPDSSFVHGMSVFENYGFEVHTRDKNSKIIYVCPSHMTSYGDVMPTKRRIELVNHSEKMGSLVIEDDYDNDFVYQKKPTPSLYTLSKADNIVYMGSFSNVLIPSIRISFMVLTNELAEIFHYNKERFAQTASKTEQIALCGFIRDGHINTQTRKIRRLYTSKAKLLLDEVKKEIPNVTASLSENSLQVKLSAKFTKDVKAFEENGLAVHINNRTNDKIQLVLSPSAVNEEDIPKAVKILKSVLSDSET